MKENNTDIIIIIIIIIIMKTKLVLKTFSHRNLY